MKRIDEWLKQQPFFIRIELADEPDGQGIFMNVPSKWLKDADLTTLGRNHKDPYHDGVKCPLRHMPCPLMKFQWGPWKFAFTMDAFKRRATAKVLQNICGRPEFRVKTIPNDGDVVWVGKSKLQVAFRSKER